MGLVDRLGPIDHDVFARHTDVDPHAVELALVVMSMRCLHHHRAADNAVVETFELGRLLADALLDGGGGVHVAKTDLQRNLHSETSPTYMNSASSCPTVAENAQDGQMFFMGIGRTPAPMAGRWLEWHKWNEGSLRSRPLLEVATGCASAQGLVARWKAHLALQRG